MSYSEKTARALDKYIRKLVRRQPEWLRALFDQGKVSFVITDEGELVTGWDAGVSEGERTRGVIVLEKYMDKYPCEAISVLEVHSEK